VIVLGSLPLTAGKEIGRRALERRIASG